MLRRWLPPRRRARGARECKAATLMAMGGPTVPFGPPPAFSSLPSAKDPPSEGRCGPFCRPWGFSLLRQAGGISGERSRGNHGEKGYGPAAGPAHASRTGGSASVPEKEGDGIGRRSPLWSSQSDSSASQGLCDCGRSRREPSQREVAASQVLTVTRPQGVTRGKLPSKGESISSSAKGPPTLAAGPSLSARRFLSTRRPRQCSLRHPTRCSWCRDDQRLAPAVLGLSLKSETRPPSACGPLPRNTPGNAVASWEPLAVVEIPTPSKVIRLPDPSRPGHGSLSDSVRPDPNPSNPGVSSPNHFSRPAALLPRPRKRRLAADQFPAATIPVAPRGHHMRLRGDSLPFSSPRPVPPGDLPRRAVRTVGFPREDRETRLR